MRVIQKLAFLCFVSTILLNGAVSYSCELVIYGNHQKPPKYYLYNNTPTGILVDIMKYTEQETDCSFDIQLYPWKRAYINALKGNGGIIGLSKNTERLKIFDYSDVMFYDDLLLVVLKGNEFDYKNIKDLKGKTLGVQRGGSFGDEFERGKAGIFKVIEDDGQISRLRRLLKGRIDVALIGPGRIGLDMVIAQDQLLSKSKEQFVVLSKPFKRDPNFLGFKKTMNMSGFIKKFNKAIEQCRKSGECQKIVDSYSVLDL